MTVTDPDDDPYSFGSVDRTTDIGEPDEDDDSIEPYTYVRDDATIVTESGGSPGPEPMLAGEKSVHGAMVLSLMWPGLGHVYAGDYGAGLVFTVLAVLNGPLIFIGIGVITHVLLVVAAAGSAGQYAKEHNEALDDTN